MEDPQNEILVSICCTAYNHEKYIEQALEGFVMQQCNFKFEILVSDDASTDNTASIIKRYESNYPYLFQVFYLNENQYSKGNKPLFNILFPATKGKYIALCEGDDYWTDPLKLQKQVDFLEENEEFSMICTNAEVIINDSGKNTNITTGLTLLQESRTVYATEIISKWMVPTASVLFRRNFLGKDLDEISGNKDFMFGDTVLFLYLASKGKVYGMKDFTVAYRRHEGGATNIPIDIIYYEKDYRHLRKLIAVFGNHLLTETVKFRLSDYALSLGFYNLKKGKVASGLKYFHSSIRYNPKCLQNYLLNKFS